MTEKKQPVARPAAKPALLSSTSRQSLGAMFEREALVAKIKASARKRGPA